MAELTITCDRCKAQVDHRCNAELMPAIVKLFTWSPHVSVLDKKSPYYDEEDEGAPFLTEATLYNLLGKDDARTLLALVNQVIAAAGIDQMGVYHAVNAAMEVIDKEQAEQATQRARQHLISKISARGEKGYWVVADQWYLVAHLDKLAPRWEVSDAVIRKGVVRKKYTKHERKEED